MVAYVAEGADRQAIADRAIRRFGYSKPVVGTGPELLDYFGRLKSNGIERAYVWFCDFAPDETLAGFGMHVTGPLQN